nr:MAG TPA: hypothetical protein [Caudoviricetes sp.]
MGITVHPYFFFKTILDKRGHIIIPLLAPAYVRGMWIYLFQCYMKCSGRGSRQGGDQYP